jgi:hypothetical protein
MELTPKGEIIKGYKATDKNMRCRGFQYELGKWYEHDGDISMCESGFHFCEYPSGPWSYYNNGRLFRIEAEFVLKSIGPGAGLKHVCRRIRLIKEIKVDGNMNTGNMNTGYMNTGYRNIGNENTGNENTGYRNIGNENTGYMNTGDRNTGYTNTGDGNTGDRNTGDRNTGDGNAGNYHSGCLNFGDAKFYIFNELAIRGDVDYSLVNKLSELLLKDDTIDPTPFLSLPNASADKIKALHEAHKKARSMRSSATR